MSSNTRQQLEKWLKTITVGGRVLDIGGSQKPVADRVQKKEGTVFEILDLEIPHEGDKPELIADINEPFSREFIMDITSYDNVFCLEVMEYVWNPVQALRNIRNCLKDGGTLFISTPFIYPVHNPKEQDYLRYTEFGIRKLLQETGFEIRDIESRFAEHKPLLEAFFSIEGMKPSREYEGHDAVGHLIMAVKI